MKLFGKVLSITPSTEHTANREYVIVGFNPERGNCPFPQTITLLNQNWKVGDSLEFDVIAGTGKAAG